MNSCNPSSPYSGGMSKCRTKLFLGSNWLGQNRQWEQNVLCCVGMPQGPGLALLVLSEHWARTLTSPCMLERDHHFATLSCVLQNRLSLSLLLRPMLASFVFPWLLLLPLLVLDCALSPVKTELMCLGQHTPASITFLVPKWDPHAGHCWAKMW